MYIRPGGELASRPLHLYWIADCSASMNLDGKIQVLNNAVQEAVPHMRLSADENPNASVFLRALRFSSGARWVEPAPVPLERYAWTTLAADDLPRTAAFSAEFRNRLDREGAKSGDIQISLIWHNMNDLDLHVFCPDNSEIYFADRTCECGGELDVDMNVSPTSNEPVENIYWPPGGAPAGHYKVYVDHYRNHNRPGCKDPTSYKVAVSVGGVLREFSGAISNSDKMQLVHEFDFDPSNVQPGNGGNTDMGAAFHLLAAALKVPPMPERALPPVLVLLSDGQPTDDFDSGLTALMRRPWAKKAVRLAISIGHDADLDILQRFIGHNEMAPLQANNPEALTTYIHWVSTVVLKSVSAPATRVVSEVASLTNVQIPAPPKADTITASDVW